MDVQIPCICPLKGDERRHPDGDTITLRDKLPFAAVSTIRWSVAIQRETDPATTIAEEFGTISEFYVLFGIAAWTLVDVTGKPIEVSKAAIRVHLLTVDGPAQIVSDAADDLYQAVMLPLLRGASTSSPPSSTTESTSPPTGSLEKPPRRSKPSSITPTPTAATETTSSSLDGASSSSLSSATAA